MLAIDLCGRTALVTGGSRGIGAAVSEALCAAGAVVVFTHTGSPAHQGQREELLARIRKQGGSAEAVALDACDAGGTAALVQEVVERHGALDVLVCNVGRNLPRPAESVSDAEWMASIDINLTCAFYAVRAVLPHMVKAGRGRIILIGSSAAYDGGGGAIDYAAAKAGLNGMMLYLVKNYARRGIVTNTIHPCVIETDLLRERYSSAEAVRELVSQIPVGRLGKPEDIGGLVAYLASPWGDYVCGQSILVDGGRTLGR
ncbi:MAG TPA: SDR family NAD(P)-dependent oxidoreductase [Armatimonadota bacterium]|nr:SDR family NAD(P)-dependent oxidoreductase [Armatimonadota bacterium]